MIKHDICLGILEGMHEENKRFEVQPKEIWMKYTI